MVFKTVDGHLTSVFNKVEKVKTGLTLTNDEVQQLVSEFNQFNSKQNFGQDYEKFIKDVTNENLNVSLMFSELAEKGASAKASVEGVYAAILDGNTKGFTNVKSSIELFNQAQQSGADNARAFAKAVGQSNTQLGNYLGGLNGAKASLVGYGTQLAITTAKTIGLRAVTMALNAALSFGVLTVVSLFVSKLGEWIVTQKELTEQAKESAEKTDEQVKSLEKLKNKYTEICDSSDSEISKVQQLIELKNELTDTYGLTEDALHNLNLEREQGIELLEREIKLANIASRGEWLGNNASAIKTARNKIESNQNGLTGGQTDGIIRIEDVSVDGKIDLNNIDDKIINMFKSAEHKSDDGLLFQYTEFEVAGDDMIEKYENLQEIISALGNDTDRTDEEERLLELLNNEAAAMKKVLDENRSIYETEKKMVAENLFDNYVNENSIKGLGKESYYVWRDGLLKSADGDKRIKKNLEMILAEQLPDLESYYNNLSTAKKMFAYIPKDSSASEAEYAKTTNEDRQHFLTELDDNELEIATKIPDLFSEGLEGASQKIAAWKSNPDNTIKAEVDEKSLEDIQKAYEALSKSADSFIKNQKSLKSALEEQEKHGQLSASTIRELSEAGYSEALVTDKVTGAVTLDMQAYEKLNAQKQEKIRLDLENEKNDLEEKLRDEQSAVSDLRQEYEALAKADMEANAGRLSEITLELAKRGANIEDIRGLISQINGDITSLTAPSFENDNTDKNKEAFDKLYSQWNHDLEMNKVTQDEYINWLDGAYKHYFSDLTKYQDEYNKYEEEVYKYRTDREQELFDKKIDNLEKLADKALDSYKDGDGNELTVTASFDYARDQINKAITETQARIDGIRNGTISGDTDDIEALIDDLDSLYDKLIDINKKEIESEKDYISELKDDYSDMMDERIDKVDELSDKIEKSYDKQIDALEKIKDTEDRIKKIKDAQLEVKEKEKALDEAKREDAKNSYVYFDGAGMSVQTSTENQQKAQQELEESRKDLEEAYREEEINVLKEQKEAATTYYDNVKDNLEKQKTQGEKTYEAVEKIYEQLGGDKKQTSSNAELVKKLSKSGDISKAMSELSDAERQKVIDTGVVKVQPNGDYTFD